MKLSGKYTGLLARFYDADHLWRNYCAQVQSLETFFPTLDDRLQAKVIELCCGSGSHTLEIAKMGFDVTGVDMSAELLKIAARKLKSFKSGARVLNQDILTSGGNSALRNQFDAAVLLGWSLNIYPIYAKFRKILVAVHRMLKPGGIFIFDASIGNRCRAVPQRALQYRLPDGWRGKLKIEESNRKSGNSWELLYRWQVSKNGGAPKELTAHEKLAVVSPRDVLSEIARTGRFRILRQARGYSLARPYQTGGRNLVIALQKM